MANRPRIGVACPIPGERAALLEWLSGSGYEPVPMVDVDGLAREIDARRFEALIGDADLIREADARHLLRALGGNRPLIVVGDDAAEVQAEAGRWQAPFLARPAQRETVILAVSLALAEGRPARRSPRRPVARIPASVDGVVSRILDVSYDGVRFEIPEEHRTQLPPSFSVRVAMFKVSVIAHRVWVNAPLHGERDGTVWCGAALRKSPGMTPPAWQTFVDHAPAAAEFDSEPRTFN